MPFRARPPQGRSFFIAAILVLAAAGLAAAPPVMGAGGTSPSAVPKPREMVRGDVSGYRLPFEPGTEVSIEQGWNTRYSHNGRSRYAYDFGLYRGTPVLAAAAGVVAYTHAGETACGGEDLRRDANYVTINHADGSATHYGHLARIKVKVGDVVEAGEVIGRSGATGFSGCMPHLHFARQLQGGPVTRSIPIYFQGYEDRQFRTGDVVRARTGCEASLASATRAGEATESFCGSYFAGVFDGPELFARTDRVLAIDRLEGGPGGYWLDAAESYSARWAGRFGFARSWYTFRIEASGGVRVWLDGVLLVDAWDEIGGVAEVEVERLMQGEVGQLLVEHYSTGPRDVLRVDWAPVLSRTPMLIDD